MSATIALGFWIRQGGDKSMDFLFGRDKGKIGIEFPDRKLCWIPWFMKHVDGEEPELEIQALMVRSERDRFF